METKETRKRRHWKLNRDTKQENRETRRSGQRKIDRETERK